MARVKRAVASKKHRRAVLERAKGYYGNKSRSYRAANEQVMHSLQYAYRDRRARKGDFRRLWIQRINAGCRQHGLSYNRFIDGLHTAGIEVDRKVLADLAVTDPAAFGTLVEKARTAVEQKASETKSVRDQASVLTPLGPRHPEIQRLRRLARDRATREDEQAFLIEGPTLVAEAVRADWPLEAIYVEDGAAVEGLPHGTSVAPGVLERVATTVTPRPVVAVARRRVVSLGELRDSSFVVVLAALADPGNLGTIVRSAEAAGVDGVIVAGGVDPFNPKSVRASAGAIFFVPVVLADDAASALEEIGSWGVRRIGTSADASRRYDEIDMSGPVAVVLGSESHGMPDEVTARVDEVVSIPMAGQAESLNVAAAAAVLCFEVARQRRAV